jgi:hypothetical protein
MFDSLSGRGVSISSRSVERGVEGKVRLRRPDFISFVYGFLLFVNLVG